MTPLDDDAWGEEMRTRWPRLATIDRTTLQRKTMALAFRYRRLPFENEAAYARRLMELAVEQMLGPAHGAEPLLSVEQLEVMWKLAPEGAPST